MNDNAAVKRQLADVARMVHLSAYTDILAGNTSAGLFIVDELIADLQRRVAALESNVQKMHVAQDGSGEKHPSPAPIAEGKGHIILGDGIRSPMFTLRVEYQVESAVRDHFDFRLDGAPIRVVIYADKEAQS